MRKQTDAFYNVAKVTTKRFWIVLPSKTSESASGNSRIGA